MYWWRIKSIVVMEFNLNFDPAGVVVVVVVGEVDVVVGLPSLLSTVVGVGVVGAVSK